MPSELNYQRYIKAVRLYLNDNPTMNRIIRGEESSDDRIRLAINLALSNYDTTDPEKSGYTVDSFPSMSLLIDGAIIQILKMNGLLHARNKLSYSTCGLTISLFDKDATYMKWIQLFYADYERKAQKQQIQVNIANALGNGPQGLHSQYLLAAFDVLPD